MDGKMAWKNGKLSMKYNKLKIVFLSPLNK